MTISTLSNKQQVAKLRNEHDVRYTTAHGKSELAFHFVTVF